MKKFMNRAEDMVAEGLSGFVAAHDDLVAFGPDRKFVRRRALTPGKVAVISGGGAGHEPMHTGLVGTGMLDAACTGHIFTSPTPDQILAAIAECDTGGGAVLVVKNYDGDVMNFEMAAEMATARGHRVETVVVDDDVATTSSGRSSGRRGVAGTLVVERILGAAAEAGADLAALKALGIAAVDNTRTIGVALKGVTVPDTARQTFSLGPDEMEVGVGIHGEPGRSRQAFRRADELAELLCAEILDRAPFSKDQPFLLLVNGFGATPVAELYVAYDAIRRALRPRRLSIARSLVGTFVTSLDMAGLSVTLTGLGAGRQALWDSPVRTAALRWGM
ncbi:dihydroxyacetone kinase subunit DhaK [Rhizobium sp. TRM95111]|uniref:dihydroxyacetone kinase subunit DhaK n=1 Tax=Rhizobium alarense TaxID=2846851 RepID=UPI001F18797E|nr:dihydroxyacetone kinase subunit DhaK [Rhizobium alarense]MCF3640839.1 dihydroxyacetone kinase subunit DhaK [Rhizobium alarense]